MQIRELLIVKLTVGVRSTVALDQGVQSIKNFQSFNIHTLLFELNALGESDVYLFLNATRIARHVLTLIANVGS